MSGKSKRARLNNLLKENPHCSWCGCLVTIENRRGRIPPDGATLDHLISRNNKNWKKGARNSLVLSCSKCNNGRQLEETRALSIEELWRRSGRGKVKNFQKGDIKYGRKHM